MCVIEMDADTLLVLGGSGNPKGRYKYTFSTNLWEQLTDLPFNVNNGGCAKVLSIGLKIV